jgi:hypothetical protein
MTKSVVELNGKKYDAVTGKELAPATPKTSQPTVSHVKHKGTNMDGFVRAPQAQTIHPATAHHPKPKATAPKQHSPHHAARKPQGTKTLMRHVVAKPHKVSAVISGISATIDSTTVSVPAETRQKRLKQAATISKSPLISRFGSVAAKPTVTKKVEHVPVTPAPPHHAPKLTTSQPMPAHKPVAQKRTPSAADAHIAKALEQATSHTKPQLAKQKRRHKAAHKLGVSSKFISTAAASLAVLLLVGFFAYQNVPNISVRMAASKAGFDAKLPGYQPTGFAMNGPVQAGPGVVTLNFASNSDDRAFQISQRPSSWNSESLLSNFVETKTQPYQKYQEAGKTIYLYDNSSATWVSGGVWYQIEGDSSLSSDQLLRIASSL